MSLQEEVAIAIYAVAFEPRNEAEARRQRPSPGWCWDKTSEEMRRYARRQAAAALRVMREKT